MPLAVIDVRDGATANADYQLTLSDIKAYESEYGPLPQGACVAMMSGWDAHARTKMFRNADADGGLHFPGFHPETAQAMLSKGASGAAVDTLSLDFGASKDWSFHYQWLGAGRWGLEGVANLDQVPRAGAWVVVGEPSVKGATGGISRVIALI